MKLYLQKRKKKDHNTKQSFKITVKNSSHKITVNSNTILKEIALERVYVFNSTAKKIKLYTAHMLKNNFNKSEINYCEAGPPV